MLSNELMLFIFNSNNFLHLSFFTEKINGEDGEISYIRSGDGEDEERGMGYWRLEAGG